jgi:transposase
MGGSSAIRWIARAKIGELKPRPQGRCRASSLDVHETLIVGMIEKCKDITLNEMVTRLAAEQSIGSAATPRAPGFVAMDGFDMSMLGLEACR